MKITNSGHAISEAVKVGHFTRDQAATVRQIVRLAQAEEQHSMTPARERDELKRLRHKRRDIMNMIGKELSHYSTLGEE